MGEQTSGPFSSCHLDRPRAPFVSVEVASQVVANHEADHVGIIQAHNGVLQHYAREALVPRLRPDFVAIEHAVLHPWHWPVHTETHGPDGHREQELPVVARGPARAAAAAAARADVDVPH